MSGGYIFGTGRGHLSARVASAAARLGAQLVNHTDPQCTCGYGCRPFSCRASARHWFTLRNLGNGRQEADRILADLRVELGELGAKAVRS